MIPTSVLVSLTTDARAGVCVGGYGSEMKGEVYLLITVESPEIMVTRKKVAIEEAAAVAALMPKTLEEEDACTFLPSPDTDGEGWNHAYVGETVVWARRLCMRDVKKSTPARTPLGLPACKNPGV